MKDETLKQILQENLKKVESENFNNQIIQKLNVESQKQRPILFDEKSIVQWFMFIASFVLFFNLSQKSEPDVNVILVGIAICTIPLLLLVFNKIYLIKNQKR